MRATKMIQTPTAAAQPIATSTTWIETVPKALNAKLDFAHTCAAFAAIDETPIQIAIEINRIGSRLHRASELGITSP